MSVSPSVNKQTATPLRGRYVVPHIIVYSHSMLVYWWPVWVLGYLMALLTWWHPTQVALDGAPELFYPSTNLGVIYALVVILVLVITTTDIRGLASLVTLLVVAFLVLLFAYLDWWSAILGWFGSRRVHLSLGFYLFFSTALLIVWLLTVFMFDHLSFWRVRPGQITHEFVMGIVDKSYDTETMVLTKRQGDLLRHWLLGLGSGDLKIRTMGGMGVEITLENVLFAARKETQIQRLIATREEVVN